MVVIYDNNYFEFYAKYTDNKEEICSTFGIYLHMMLFLKTIHTNTLEVTEYVTNKDFSERSVLISD